MTSDPNKLKFSDLGFGFLNNCSDQGAGNSVDRRRSDGTDYLKALIQDTFQPRAMGGVGNTMTGIVMHCSQKKPGAARTKEGILSAYARTGLQRAWDKVKSWTSDGLVNVYKVYIPEIECRPAPLSFEDPVVFTYYDVYEAAGLDAKDPIPLGSVVHIKFENIVNFKNPTIVWCSKEPVAFEGEGGAASSKSSYDKGTSHPVGDGYPPAPHPRAPLPPATDEQVPSERGILPNGSPQADYPGGPPPYVLPLNVSRMKSDRMYLNNTENPVTHKRERHHAVDHGASSGTPILAIADGVVTFTRAGSEEAGNYIVTQHTDVINGGDLWVRQLHMVEPTTLKKGDQVSRGQVIGYVGTTGRSTGPHVHFEIGKTGPTTAKWRPVGNKINPIGYYPDGWFVTHAGKAYIFPDRMDSGPSA